MHEIEGPVGLRQKEDPGVMGRARRYLDAFLIDPPNGVMLGLEESPLPLPDRPTVLDSAAAGFAKRADIVEAHAGAHSGDVLGADIGGAMVRGYAPAKRQDVIGEFSRRAHEYITWNTRNECVVRHFRPHGGCRSPEHIQWRDKTNSPHWCGEGINAGEMGA
jgi:hypothetical protein